MGSGRRQKQPRRSFNQDYGTPSHAVRRLVVSLSAPPSRCEQRLLPAARRPPSTHHNRVLKRLFPASDCVGQHARDTCGGASTAHNTATRARHAPHGGRFRGRCRAVARLRRPCNRRRRLRCLRPTSALCRRALAATRPRTSARSGKDRRGGPPSAAASSTERRAHDAMPAHLGPTRRALQRPPSLRCAASC